MVTVNIAIALALSVLAFSAVAQAQSLRFYGHGESPGEQFVFSDRVKIDRAPPSPVANLGAADLTVEFFARGLLAENPNGGVGCRAGNAWVQSNIVIDADRFGGVRAWGIGFLDGAVAFGILDDFVAYTLCGTTNVLDDAWHHVAVDRNAATGEMRIWVDGALESAGPPGGGGPAGSLAYLDTFVPGTFCSPDGGGGSQSCIHSDPFLVFGAEKHGFIGINYSGYLDEVRLSNALRYDAPFVAPSTAFAPDADTVALYHFDEPSGTVIVDAAGAQDGVLFFGGSPPAGPMRSAETPLPEPGVAAAGAGALGTLLALARGAHRRRRER